MKNNIPNEATHRAVNKETGKEMYVVKELDSYIVLPRGRFKVVLGYNRFDVYPLEAEV